MEPMQRASPCGADGPQPDEYREMRDAVVSLLVSARQSAARAVNSVMTATYWEIGRRIVEVVQAGEERAEYGRSLLQKRSADLTSTFGRGFSADNLESMRRLYLAYPPSQISETRSRKTPFTVQRLAERFRLPWSHYVRLLRVESREARQFYEEESFRNGWTVRQLDRQVSTFFYERTLASRNKKLTLKGGATPRAGESPARADEFQDPFVLEFLDLKDKHTESDFEAALLHKLEDFLLELGGDFCFIGRQRRLRIGDSWFKVDLLFFHRRLQCLVIIDLKLGRLTHEDLGQMQMYVNWYREEATLAHENPPIGLILCTDKDEAVVRYTLPKESGRIIARLYRTYLPREQEFAAEVQRQRTALEVGSKQGGGE